MNRNRLLIAKELPVSSQTDTEVKMAMNDYLTPRNAAAALGISPATITRMKQAGAPTHHWGPPGSRMYRIILAELIEWMDTQGGNNTSLRIQNMTIDQLREARHKAVNKRKMTRN